MAQFCGFHASCQGFSHIKSTTPCQDASDYFADGSLVVCAVSDGHGGDKYFRSDVGAQKAVGIAVAAVREFMDRQGLYAAEGRKSSNNKKILTADNYVKILSELAAYIVCQWVGQVEEHWAETPPTEAETALLEKHFAGGDGINILKIYGATLIAGVMSEDANFAMQIGDGAVCVIKANGAKEIPAETVDEGQFGGHTNSLSSSDCLPLFSFYYAKKPLKAIVVASDGVTDSYGGNDGRDFLNFCGKMVELYEDDYQQAQAFVEEWLPCLSGQGSQDDMSVAGVLRLTESVNEGVAMPANEMEMVSNAGDNQEGITGPE